MLWKLFVDAVDKLVYWTWVIPDCESGHLCWICVSCFWTALWMTEEAEPTSVPNMLQYPCLSFSSGLHDSFPNVLDIKPGKKQKKDPEPVFNQLLWLWCHHSYRFTSPSRQSTLSILYVLLSGSLLGFPPPSLQLLHNLWARQKTILLVFLWTFFSGK